MGETIHRRLPLVYALLTPLAWFVALGLAAEPTLDGLRLVIYVVYASSALAIAAGLVYLVRRSDDGKASVWLVSVMYEAVFFACSLVGILSLTILRLLYPDLLIPGVSADPLASFLQRLAYALIAGSAMGTLISASVLVYGFFRGHLDMKIYPWPWPPTFWARVLKRGLKRKV